MEQELINLLLIAKKALSTGQAICAQANELSLESNQHVVIIERTWPKILFVRNHILIQLSTLERIREFVSVKIEEDREVHLAGISLDLQNIFRDLKSRRIDEEVIEINSREHDAKNWTTLFDYIDHQYVLHLQKLADEEITDIENLYSSLTSTAKTLSVTISELASMQEAALSISLDESASAFADEKAHIQELTISKMAEILTSLTNHYIQLGEATRLCQSEPDALLDIRGEMLNEEIRVRMRIYSSVQEELLKLLSELETFSTPGGQADMICDKMVNAEAEMKTHEQKLAAYFKELTALRDSYREYATSYSYLILEIQRRKKAVEKQEELMQELSKSFEDGYNDEVLERRRWFAQHGDYIPESLCRFMMVPPSRLVVQIQEQPRRLPDLSQSTIQKVERSTFVEKTIPEIRITIVFRRLMTSMTIQKTHLKCEPKICCITFFFYKSLWR
ncbi:autophagy protein Apg17-domain-containing protein [Dichotomocladium elegans]|nr:autophagy protein Apg17-domain-containing protein [Dichotomocladium elegans]